MCQESENLRAPFSDYQISSEKYMTDSNGNVMMYVNIWGEVKNPGHHLVYEGIDIGTLLSIVGGSTNNANLKNVRLHRETPDIDGTITYNVNLHKFIVEGGEEAAQETKIRVQQIATLPLDHGSKLRILKTSPMKVFTAPT